MDKNKIYRKKIVCGNWKMNHSHYEAVQTFQQLKATLIEADLTRVDVVVHPPFTSLRSLQTIFEAEKLGIFLGAQHCYFEKSGAYTGEISPEMLAKLHVSYVIVGHSERRTIFNQTDEIVNKTTKAILNSSMYPVVCVGESLEIRQAGTQESFVESQVEAAFSGVKTELIKRAIVAYEPIWAIGTGNTATSEDAQLMCKTIRSKVRDLYDDDTSDLIRIVYGGSVNQDNAGLLCAETDIDGLLVGGASLDGVKFGNVVKAVI